MSKKRKLRDLSKPMPPEGICPLCGEEENSDCSLCEKYQHECLDCKCSKVDCPCCLTGVCSCNS